MTNPPRNITAEAHNQRLTGKIEILPKKKRKLKKLVYVADERSSVNKSMFDEVITPPSDTPTLD